MIHDTYRLMNAEQRRLEEAEQRVAHWKRWGPYLSERQWATVREDYSADGNSWAYFPHDHARSRAYRWGEDGLLGITDRQCRLCFALALWNGRDPILKERLFGLTGVEGNHAEDVKECYYYLDSTPTHSYMKGLYKYPQAEFPYRLLVEENRRRGLEDREFELSDTGVFKEGRYFDVFAEYAKAAPNDILIRITVANRGPEAAVVHLLPTLWFRNTWSWGGGYEGDWPRPHLALDDQGRVIADHATLGRFCLLAAPQPAGGPPRWLFTENETNNQELFGDSNPSPYCKDAFHRYLIEGHRDAVNPAGSGTKAAAHYLLNVPPRSELTIPLRLCDPAQLPADPLGSAFSTTFEQRIEEAEAFDRQQAPAGLDDDQRRVLRQARAGLLWTKQFYYYSIRDWLDGDPAHPPPAPERRRGRNHDWLHLFNRDILSMPDKWEYPWYAVWDTAFHMIPFAAFDPQFAKEQLILLLREWYLHPNGQIPAYEFKFNDVNPPVHAWACWQVYTMTAPHGRRDRRFLARVFQKLLLNFTWWVNRKDIRGRHLFSGGFLGLDNIGVFDRSRPLPTGGHLEQADGTAWMAFFCANMLAMALELAVEDPAYEDMASKFFEHFVAIADAINTLDGTGLWDEHDGFYYDHLHVDGSSIPLRIRSLVGLIPLFAVDVLDEATIEQLPDFRKRMQWFLENRPDLARHISCMQRDVPDDQPSAHRLLALPSRRRLERTLQYLLDEREFLSPYGIRSLSRIHARQPFVFQAGGEEHRVQYVPGESTSWLFGGNSNWRGPIWFPVNYLLIESLRRYHQFYGESLQVECPTGSGQRMNLHDVARELEQRLLRLLLADPQGRRPCHGDDLQYAQDAHWRDLVLFYEYFHGDSGRGLGAGHQTGWTALAATLLQNSSS